jgi:hypothetical protein
MIIAGLFWAFLLTSCGIMSAFGGKQERTFVLCVALAVASTSILNSAYGVSQAMHYVFLIDSLLLIISLVLLAFSERNWPIWFAGFHLNTVATFAASMIFPGELPGLYASLAGVWALPALGLAAYGCVLDHRSQQLKT